MTTKNHIKHDEEVSRRNFLYVASGAVGAVGVVSAAWPFVQTMNPSADVLALSSIEVDLSPIAIGQTVKVLWRGKPVFIRHRTEEEIARAVADDKADLRDPQDDENRAIKPEWLIMIGVCTHLGCVPLDKTADLTSEYRGWFCPCHGSQYDISGRIRKGPAPRNLEVPHYEYVTDTTVKIG